jgi:hypothetical protein
VITVSQCLEDVHFANTTFTVLQAEVGLLALLDSPYLMGHRAGRLRLARWEGEDRRERGIVRLRNAIHLRKFTCTDELDAVKAGAKTRVHIWGMITADL